MKLLLLLLRIEVNEGSLLHKAFYQRERERERGTTCAAQLHRQKKGRATHKRKEKRPI
jgi:hypothetical protein